MSHDDFRRLGKQVGESNQGQRIDDYLARNFRFFSRMEWQRRLSVSSVLVNFGRAKPAYRLKASDEIHFYHPAAIEPAAPAELQILWRHRELLAVAKPAHIPIHENGAFFNNTLGKILKRQVGEEWHPLHRIDKETSGIVLCGRDLRIRSAISSAFRRNQIKKTYAAIVHGEPEWDATSCELPIGLPEQSQIRIKKWVAADGLKAETRLHCLERKKGYAFIQAEPLTGRTNQIRIHLAALGHHLVGDKLYYPDEEVFLRYADHNDLEFAATMTGHHRLCLHAQSLVFHYPESDEICVITCPPPADFLEFWHELQGKRCDWKQ